MEISKRETHVSEISEREGGKLSKFYYHSGVRETHGFVDKKPKYRMAPLSTSPYREFNCTRGYDYE